MLTALLLSACSSTVFGPEAAPTDTQPPAVPSPVPATSTPPPPATPTPAPETPAGLQPLDAAECGVLAEAVAAALGVPATTAEAPFEDYVGGETGTGCRVAATGNGLAFADVNATINDLLAALEVQGWQEDVRYGAGGAGGWAAGYRKDDALCLFVFSSEPSDEGLCSDDEPMAVCWERLTPEQQIRNFVFDCVQGSSAGVQ
jgi:hypothetical protein